MVLFIVVKTLHGGEGGSVADLEGVLRVIGALPLSQFFFIFRQFSVKILPNIRLPPLRFASPFGKSWICHGRCHLLFPSLSGANKLLSSEQQDTIYRIYSDLLSMSTLSGHRPCTGSSCNKLSATGFHHG